MKSIALPAATEHQPRAIIKAVAETPSRDGGQQVPITIGEMRQRIRILDALDKSTDTLTLEDADYDRLVALFDVFPFGMAHRDIVALADAIAGAK